MLEKRNPSRRKSFSIPSLFKYSTPTLLVFFIGCGVGFIFYSFTNETSLISIVSNEQSSIQPCFSPEGHCTDRIVSAIENANTSILVMSYSFTSAPIASALATAHVRGVDVKILVDRSQLKGKYTQIPYLSQSKIPILVDSVEGIAHNKTMIIDDRVVLTGSFNWTKAAESRNAENILLINNHSLAKIYKQNWEHRASGATEL